MSASDPKLVEPVAWLRSHPSGLKVAATSPATQSWQLEGGWTEMPLFPASALEAAEARIAALEAENGALREAHRQIARGVDGINPYEVSRAALRQAEEKSDG